MEDESGRAWAFVSHEDSPRVTYGERRGFDSCIEALSWMLRNGNLFYTQNIELWARDAKGELVTMEMSNPELQMYLDHFSIIED